MISFQLAATSKVRLSWTYQPSKRYPAIRSGRSPSHSASGGVLSSRQAYTFRPQASTRTGSRDSSAGSKSDRGTSSNSGAATSEPSSPYPQRWYGQRIMRDTVQSSEASSVPRWRHELMKPRSTPSRSRVMSTEVSPTVRTSTRPGSATSAEEATATQARPNSRRCSSAKKPSSV